MRIGAAILVVLALCSPAFGQFAANPNFPYVCSSANRILTAPKPGEPSLVNATLTRFPRLAFQLCDDRFGTTHYFLRAPEAPVNGVCVFYENEVFSPADPKTAGNEMLDPNDKDDAIHWSAPPKPWSTKPFAGQKTASTRIDGKEFPATDPQAYMAEGAPCPHFDETIYAGMRNVAPDIFKSVSAYLRTLASSQTIFDEAVSHLAPALKCELFPVERFAIRARDTALKEIRAGFFERHGAPTIVNMGVEGDKRAYYSMFRIEGSDRLFSARVIMTGDAPVLECLGPTYVA